jgi:hypothetical protein
MPAYPTGAEANKYVEGEGRKRRVTRGQMRLAARYNAWMRGEAGLASVIAGLGGLGDKSPYHAEPAETLE